MSRNCQLRWIAASLFAVLLVATGPPANADEIDWLSPRCATGQITHHSAQRHANGDVTIQLNGWSARCGAQGVPGDVYQFGIGLYTDRGAWLGGLTAYQGLRSTPFAYLVDYTAATEELGEPPLALCLASGPARRLSCLAVTPLPPPKPPALEPLASNDPRVQSEITDPCGNCLMGAARAQRAVQHIAADIERGK
jgi:hypothetical protein